MASKREIEIAYQDLSDENDSLRESLADIKAQIEELISNDSEEDEDSDSEDEDEDEDD